MTKPIPLHGLFCLLFASGVSLWPGQALTQGNTRAVCAQGSGQVAVTACEEELRGAPADPEIARALARHYNDAGRFDDALEVLNNAIEFNPEHHGLLYDVGATICFKSTGSEAIIVCKAALRAAPADVAVARTLARRYREAQRFGEALDVLNGALERNPNDKYLLHDISIARSDFAEDEWLRSQKAEDDESTAEAEKSVDRLARIRCRRLQGRAALEACDTALIAEPDDPVLRVHRAAHLEALGETTRAIADYRAALASDPENAEARNRLSVLDP